MNPETGYIIRTVRVIPLLAASLPGGPALLMAHLHLDLAVPFALASVVGGILTLALRFSLLGVRSLKLLFVTVNRNLKLVP